MSTQQVKLRPIGTPLFTRPTVALGVLGAIAGALLVWRFLFGIGSVTALNDGYPWGLWIAFDVVVGTALATGGYAIAILVYLLNRGQYHPLIRSALVTSALGYTLGGFGVIIDLGRYWNVYKVPSMFWRWNLHSVLLEVALCIMLYTLVVWVELAPTFLQKLSASSNERFRRISTTSIGWLKKAMPWLVALGLLLPTMHQSSLGSLMLLAGPKLHPLWRTPLLPLLFLISCIAMGFAVVVLESSLSALAFKLPRETGLMHKLSRTIANVIFVYAGIRLVDITARGRFSLAFSLDPYAGLFWLEMALFLVPAILIVTRGRLDGQLLFRCAMSIVFAGALYRFSVFLIAFNPGPGWRYFPAPTEMLVTIGLVSAEIIAYIVIVKKFPILAGAPRPNT
jgi:Ni/Fe-hydrogenase subunit HybB-like protein